MVLGLGIMQVSPTFGQDPAKKDAPPAKPDASKEAKTDAVQGGDPEARRARQGPAKPPTAKKEEAPQATEPPLPPIPKEVQAKIDAARRAVAEAIVAAQDAGLVETSIDPPPILDILITGRATDARTLKNASAKKPYAVSPEVFAAWFTGYGTPGFENDRLREGRPDRPPQRGAQGVLRPAGGHPEERDRRGPQGQGDSAAPSRPRPSRPRSPPRRSRRAKPAETKPASPSRPTTKKAGEPKK